MTQLAVNIRKCFTLPKNEKQLAVNISVPRNGLDNKGAEALPQVREARGKGLRCYTNGKATLPARLLPPKLSSFNNFFPRGACL